ncbi:hypothetical protein BAUCODRAFT_122457 [Baudoinia panamericana UAMH 10762]|uniref:Uncharacterized protein n=1 Tax=Baudoinia panamericana (strain UAMH 10762) TaxID=717646 RepID=M2NBC7_BAUPA|nr:uncharacterized protein BAUCODRAFT_122457 [Baudoinia panamericana UAMH 10762]EMC96454.1 hypothetical protein BAUCODRAFT_122457 [Baudoinia panamericana UAMH 10762]
MAAQYEKLRLRTLLQAAQAVVLFSRVVLLNVYPMVSLIELARPPYQGSCGDSLATGVLQELHAPFPFLHEKRIQFYRIIYVHSLPRDAQTRASRCRLLSPASWQSELFRKRQAHRAYGSMIPTPVCLGITFEQAELQSRGS